MKAQSYSIPALVRKLILVAFLAAGPLLTQSGQAQSVVTATLTSGGMNSITIDQNGLFTLTLGVTTNFVSGGYTLFYQSNNGQGLFQIISRMSLDPIYPFPALDPIIFPVLLNPSTSADFGAVANTPDGTHPAGTFNLQSVMISALNAPIGTYTIFLDNRSVMTDRTGGGFFDVNMGGPNGPIFTINVVPEPGTMGLLAMAGAVVPVLVWRRRRTGLLRKG